MRYFGPAREDPGGTVFRDVIMLALFGMIACVIILLPHINPPTRESDLLPPGNVSFYVEWPEGIPADVDLWVRGPDKYSVGYSNLRGELVNLLRDDLGHTHTRDYSGLNYENAFSRGILAGEYVVNLHLYRGVGPIPVPCHVEIHVKKERNADAVLIAEKDVVLTTHGEEITVVRFRLDRNGDLVPDSVHSAFTPVRSQKR